MMVIGAACVHR